MRRPTKRINAITLKKFGDWDGVISYLDKLGHNVVRPAKKAQEDEAKKLVERVKNHIHAQDLNWQPLEESTVKRKKHNKVYQDSMLYLNNITIVKKGTTVFAGVKPGIIYKNRNGQLITLDRVARWMEFGTRRAPARPIWAPSIKEAGGAHGIRNRVAKAIYNKIKDSPSEIKVTYREVRTKVPR